MSTADDAWQEWRQTHAIPHWDLHGITEAVYKSAYRRALEDAADVIENGERRYHLGPTVTEVVRWLRDRADRVDAEDGGR